MPVCNRERTACVCDTERIMSVFVTQRTVCVRKKLNDKIDEIRLRISSFEKTTNGLLVESYRGGRGDLGHLEVV